MYAEQDFGIEAEPHYVIIDGNYEEELVTLEFIAKKEG